MSRHKESTVETFIKLPWQISAAMAVVMFVVTRWVIPGIVDGPGVKGSVALLSKSVSVPIGIFFLLLAVGSALFAAKKRQSVDGQFGLESLRKLAWKEFEWMVGEAYRRQGYAVDESLGGGADGGIDLVLRKDGQTTIVQCKHWKTVSVGVPIIREMFGVMTAMKANRVLIITSGSFTRESEAFAEGKPIELVDGPRLWEIVKGVQAPQAAANSDPSAPEAGVTPNCPDCGTPMVLRKATRGANAGNSFWGCSSYPKCRRTAPAN